MKCQQILVINPWVVRKNVQETYTGSAGFTSLELLVVFALITIMTLSFFNVANDWFVEQKTQKIIHQLESGIAYARAQAMILGTPLALSPQSSELDWSQGMVLRKYLQHDSEQSKAMATWQWRLPLNYHLLWHGAHSKKVVFFTADLAHAMSNGHFSLMLNGVELRRVVLNRLGYTHSH